MRVEPSRRSSGWYAGSTAARSEPTDSAQPRASCPARIVCRKRGAELVAAFTGEQCPCDHQVACRITYAQAAEVDDAAQPAMFDQQVSRMKVSMNPNWRAVASRCLEGGVPCRSHRVGIEHVVQTLRLRRGYERHVLRAERRGQNYANRGSARRVRSIRLHRGNELRQSGAAPLGRSAMRSMVAFSPQAIDIRTNAKDSLQRESPSQAGPGWQAAMRSESRQPQMLLIQRARLPSRCAGIARPWRRQADKSRYRCRRNWNGTMARCAQCGNCAASKRPTRETSVSTSSECILRATGASLCSTRRRWGRTGR